MATEMYFERDIIDTIDPGKNMHIEFGKTTYNDGRPEIYFNVDGKGVHMDDDAARNFCKAVSELSRYFGYDQ